MEHTSRRRARPGRLAVTASAVAVATAVATGGAGLASASTRAPASTMKASDITIALIPGITSDPFYITMENGAYAEAHKLGVHLVVLGSATAFSPETQIPIVNAELAKKPSALLIAPTDGAALYNPMEKYHAAGIPVITVDTTLNNTGFLVSRITSGNTNGGELAADTLAKLCHDTGEVMIMSTNAGSSTVDERMSGFTSEMKKYPKMKQVSTEFDNDSPTQASTLTQSAILAHSGLCGIFGLNSASGAGVGAGIQAANKKGKVFAVGYDAEPAEVASLKSGVLSGLIAQSPAEEGMLGVEYAYDVLMGKTSSVQKSVELANHSVNSLNMNQAATKQWFYASTVVTDGVTP
jgi:ribose transport system substrate-binding protein